MIHRLVVVLDWALVIVQAAVGLIGLVCLLGVAMLFCGVQRLHETWTKGHTTDRT